MVHRRIVVAVIAVLVTWMGPVGETTPSFSALTFAPQADPRLSVLHPPRAPRPKPKVKPRHIARPLPPLRPPSTNGRLIEVSIARQRLLAWDHRRIVMQLVISTGRPGYRTPRGHFRIHSKLRQRWSYKWKVWMPWAMNFYGGYFIHQLAHYPGSSQNLGASQLGRAASHGCVRVGVGAAERLYHWTIVGTPVWVH